MPGPRAEGCASGSLPPLRRHRKAASSGMGVRWTPTAAIVNASGSTSAPDGAAEAKPGITSGSTDLGGRDTLRMSVLDPAAAWSTALDVSSEAVVHSPSLS